MSDVSSGADVSSVPRKLKTTRMMALMIVFVMVATAFVTMTARAETSPVIWTSMDEYAPGDVVEILGEGWAKWVPVTIVIEHPDINPQTFVETPDIYGRFVCDDYVAEELATQPQTPVKITARQLTDSGELTASTQFLDPAAYIEGWTLKPIAKFTTGDVKGYVEGDSVPMVVVLNKRQLGNPSEVTVDIGVDWIDTTPLHVPTYGIDYLTQYWDPTPNAPFNTYPQSSSPFWVDPAQGTITSQTRQPDVYDEGHHLTVQVWSFTMQFAAGAKSAAVRFGAHLAVTDLSIDYYGASYYPGESLHVRIVDLNPPKDQGNRDVPISLAQACTPEMSLVKTGDPYYVAKGDIITFTVYWENSADCPAACVHLWDNLEWAAQVIPGSFLYYTAGMPYPMAPIPGPTLTADGWDWYIGYVGPHTSAWLSFQAVVVTNTPGIYWNYVHMTYTDDHGGSYPQLDAKAPFEILGNPVIDVEKSGPYYAHDWDVITYTYVVTNTGSVDLYDVTLTDDHAGSYYIGFLGVGDSTTVMLTYTVTPDDPYLLDNYVEVWGWDLWDRPAWDSDTWEVIILRPHVVIEKSVDPGCAELGETVWYTIYYENPFIWQTTLYDVVISDSMLFGSDPYYVGTLLPGESGTIMVPYELGSDTDSMDYLYNEATIVGYDLLGMPAEDSSSALIDVMHPGILIDKVGDRPCAEIGETITYWIYVENPSWDTAMYAEVYDMMFAPGLLWSGWIDPLTTVPLGPYTHTVTANDLDHLVNEAYVYAWDYQYHFRSASDTWEVDIYHPDIEISKWADVSCAAAGDVVWYNVEVSNPSWDTDMYATVMDPMLSSDPLFQGWLTPGQSMLLGPYPYLVTANDPDPLVNTAEVTAKDKQGHVRTASSSWSIDIYHYGIILEKTADLTCAAKDDVITFTITVTNPTLDTPKSFEVYDPMFGAGVIMHGVLQGGASTTMTGLQYIVKEGDPDPLVNTAWVWAYDPQNHASYAESSWSVNIYHPQISIYKWADLTCAAPGDTVNYYFDVSNPSWDTPMDYYLYDGLLNVGVSGSLEAGASVTLGPYPYLVTEGTSDPLVNTAYIEAWDPQFHYVYAQSSWQIEIYHPAIEIYKWAVVDQLVAHCAHADESVYYYIDVHNPSADTSMYATVYDLMLSPDPLFEGWVAAGEWVHLGPYVYVVPDGVEWVENTAYVDAHDPQVLPEPHWVHAQSSWWLEILYPQIDVEKVGPEIAEIGDTITYTVTVTNVGDTELYDVTLWDDLLQEEVGYFAMLGVGESQVVTYQYTVPPGIGEVVNTVWAWGWDKQNVYVEDWDTWTVIKYGQVTGQKIADLNANAYNDQNDVGIEGWLVVLSGVDYKGKPVYRTTYTGPGGWYLFAQVAPGQYTVSEGIVGGWQVTGDPSFEFELVSGETVFADFYNLPRGSISGYKWLDSNLNGVWDDGENGIPNWGIGLIGTDANGDPVDLWTYTGPDGSYSFTNLKPGEYTVYEQWIDGWIPTTPVSVYIDVSALDPFEIVGVNFGNARLGSITGIKWLDLDIDGVYDEGIEPLLSGWTIILTGVTYEGDPVGPIEAVTDANGAYAFYGLLPGEYTVTEVVPDGWTHITPDHFDITLTEGYQATCAKFGNIEWSSIWGWKFLDWDMDGFKDGNEPGLEGWAFTLTGFLDNGIDIGSWDPWDTPIDPITVLTDANGVWSFDHLYPGFYWVTEEHRANWYSTTPDVQDFELTSGSHPYEIKFGNVPYTCLWGYKFEDMNGNGVWDENERGVPGWTIVVEGWQNDGKYVYIELTTDENGYWATCYNILPGTYWIYEIGQEGWMPTTSDEYYFEIPRVAGPADYWFLFGNFKLGKIWGYKYEDVNGNGILDNGDKPVPNWCICLDLPWGGEAWTYTDENGYWEFTGLPAGRYRVHECNDDPDWTPSGPVDQWVDMSSGGVTGPVVFLNIRYSMVYGWKWNDLDSDGVWDLGEPGIPGWHIYMIWDMDPTVYEAVTDENGYYEFTHLLPDATYVVWEEQRDGWTPTTPTDAVFGLGSGESKMVNFGNFENVWIHVFKFEDMYSDGFYDPWYGDHGLEGWTFDVYEIYWDDGIGIMLYTPVATLVTDANGEASLEITHAGTYAVVEIGQPGWCPTTATEQWIYVTSGIVYPSAYLEFGNFKCVDITIFKYEDMNSDGQYTEGIDEPIEGWVVWVYDYMTGDMSDLYTDENGLIQLHLCHFADLYISEEMPEGWSLVSPWYGGYYYVEVTSGHAYDFTLEWPGVENYFYAFGNFECVDVWVFKYWDTCSNGFYDPEFDEPLPGWWIGLYNAAGELIAWGYTNADGWVHFKICSYDGGAGIYYVIEEQRLGWVPINPELGSVSIEVQSGDDVYLSFGNYELVNVPIFKYEDVNSDGVYEPGLDVPIEGWYFELVRLGDGYTYSGYTDEDGHLVLTVDRSGIYLLTEESRDGWTHVNPADGEMLVSITSGVQVPLLMFGNFHNVDIWVFKYADVFADGWYSPADGDAPVEGWTFTLWEEILGVWYLVDTQVTDGDGLAHFIITHAGHYLVKEEARDGWWWILPWNGEYELHIMSGFQVETLVFANFKMGKVFGHKYEDVNGNGVYDAGIDVPLAGWHIQFMSQWFYMWGETWTDENGYYEFTGLPPGLYVVWEELQDGWVPSSPPEVWLNVWGNSQNLVDFLNYRPGCIQGYKYEDVNGNHVLDGADVPISGWLISLAITGHETTPEGEISFITIIDWTWTDENGFYSFCGLAPGTYVVMEEERADWAAMTPTSHEVELTSGEHEMVPVFLNSEYGKIFGWKWNDLNGNGVWDLGEPGIPGWHIYMIWDMDPFVYPTVTDENGYFEFTHLLPDATYVVWEEMRDGWTPTTPTDAVFSLNSGDQVPVVFGNFKNVWIPIFKYEDMNGDGIYQEGLDVPIGGWEMTVSGPGVPGGSVTVATGVDGWVYVEVIAGGWYTVTEAEVPNWIHTTPNPVGVYVESGWLLGPIVFGNFGLGMIWGHKFYDANANANWDDGEVGLWSWIISLAKWNGNEWVPVETRITAMDGYYQFGSLDAGIYRVSEGSVLGWHSTTGDSVIVIIHSRSSEEVNFGNVLYGEICGHKFYDKDMDGMMDDDEPGLGGWTIVLEGVTDTGVQIYREEVTDGDGYYCFTDVPPGTYTVTEILPGPEWYPITHLPAVVDASGSTGYFEYTVDIGNVRYAKIEGYKFLDTYAKAYPFWPNGLFDTYEVGLGNWRITLQGWTDAGVRVDRVAYTDNIWDIGYYSFDGLLPGMYWLNETPQYGYYATTPISNLIAVYPFPWGPVVIRHDFGNLLPSKDPEVRFVLEKGWNLWSMPLKVTGGLKASQLATAMGRDAVMICTLDSTTMTYKSWFSGWSNPATDDFEIQLGKAYWIYANKEVSFVLKGDLSGKVSVSLAKGWNLVGWPSLTPTTASTVLKAVTGANPVVLVYLNPYTCEYDSYFKIWSGPADDFTVTQGRGYWIWVDGPATITLG